MNGQQTELNIPVPPSQRRRSDSWPTHKAKARNRRRRYREMRRRGLREETE